MKIKKIWAASFSPTGGTERIVSLLAEELGERLRIPVEKIAYTLPAEREKMYTFAGDDLLILGTPVYAGRIPNKILPDVDKSFEGKGTPAVAVSVMLSPTGWGPDGRTRKICRHFARSQKRSRKKYR